jgi:hypothetical protein
LHFSNKKILKLFFFFQYKEAFLEANPDFKWYKLPAPPLRTLVTRPSNQKPPKLEYPSISGPIVPGKLAGGHIET